MTNDNTIQTYICSVVIM